MWVELEFTCGETPLSVDIQLNTPLIIGDSQGNVLVAPLYKAFKEWYAPQLEKELIEKFKRFLKQTKGSNPFINPIQDEKEFLNLCKGEVYLIFADRIEQYDCMLAKIRFRKDKEG